MPTNLVAKPARTVAITPAMTSLYLWVFGIGSVAGMMLLSGLVGLPFAFRARKSTGLHDG